MGNSANKEVCRKSKRKPPSFFTNFKYYVNEFGDCSTIHGVRYLGEFNRTKTEWFFWFVILLISLYFCILMILETYHKWENSPVIVSFARSPTPIWKIPFPSVTVCPITTFKKDRLNLTRLWSDFYIFKNATNDEKVKLNNASLTCDDTLFYKNGSNYVTREAVDYLYEIAPGLENFFEKCRWLNDDIPCKDIFSPALTEEGVCYSFNMLQRKEIFTDALFQNKVYFAHGVESKFWSLEDGFSDKLGKDTYPRRALSAGLKSSLSLDLKNYHKDFNAMCKGPVQGFRVTLHHPTNFPRTNQQYFRVPLDHEVIVAIKPDMMTTSDGLRDYDPHRRKCYFPYERHLKYFKVYTQENCNLECLANYTLDYCGCIRFSLPHTENTTLCGAGNAVCMFEAVKLTFKAQVAKNLEETDDNLESCDCLQACTSVTYFAETSQSYYNWQKVYDGNAANDSVEDIHMSKVTIFFKEQQFINSERNELFGPVDFFANCGGLLGLFMGFSVLSIVEIFYFLSLRVISNIRRYGRQYWSGSPALINGDDNDGDDDNFKISH